ncbi:MAG: hypothetical protein K9L85_02980, partial [Candidatus Peribacteraceae bacterium]|nr:hypothetical protein [Candidatus Peribacteraceae bacterium]
LQFCQADFKITTKFNSIKMALELPEGFAEMSPHDKARFVAASKSHLPQNCREAASKALKILKNVARGEHRGDDRHLVEIQQILEQFDMRCQLTEDGIRRVIATHLGEDVVNKELGGLKFRVRGQIGAL